MATTDSAEEQTFTCNEETLVRVVSFRYLGAVFTSAGDCTAEILPRVGMARSTLHGILRQPMEGQVSQHGNKGSTDESTSFGQWRLVDASRGR